MIKIKCNYCGRKNNYGDTCICNIKSKEKAKKDKEYDKKARNKESRKIYSSRTWKRIRKQVILNTYGIDVYEYSKTGRVVQGDVVHHIVPLARDISKAYDLDNLVYLTVDNHSEVHSIYNKGEKARDKLQKVLYQAIKKFKGNY